MSRVFSSGDLRADKRFQMGVDYLSLEAFDAACDLFAQCLELAPDYLPCLSRYGEALALRGLDSDAKRIYAHLATLDKDDLFGGRLGLARLEGVTREMSAVYVAALFDDYAARFETALVKDLHYIAPRLLFEAVKGVSGAVLDLGCGTGLMGDLLHVQASSLVGVDLSADMVALAHKKQIYSALHVAEMVDFMRGQPSASFDMVIAADVFVYVGDLREVFQKAARLLPVGGTLAFTVQACDEGFHLGEDWRYAHSEATLRAWLAPSFHVKQCEAITPRSNKNQPVRGWLVMADRL